MKRTREARRGARATWPVRRYRLGEEPLDDLTHLTTAERVSLVAEISLSAWTIAGRTVRTLARADWPGKVVRTG